jgi:hypothetical protein
MNKFNFIVENILGGLTRLGAQAIKKNQGDNIYTDIMNLKTNDANDRSNDINDRSTKNQPNKNQQNNNKNDEYDVLKIDDNTDWNGLIDKFRNKQKFSIKVDDEYIFPNYDFNSFTKGNHQPSITKTFIAELNDKDKNKYTVIKNINSKTGKNNDRIVNKNFSPSTNKTKFLIGNDTFYDTLMIYKNPNIPPP